ncbi:MAG: ATP-binding protein [Rhodospirillaceae bacterium]
MDRHTPDQLIHMVCGSTGAGKSTYALDLCQAIDGVHLSIDEWMVTLFWDDSPDPLEFEWTMERVNRCETQIWATPVQLTPYKVPSVLDLGFTTKDHRTKFVELAKEAELEVQLHFLDLPQDQRWARVQHRNKKKGSTFQLAVDREMFNFVEDMWEPPDASEMAALNGVHVTE